MRIFCLLLVLLACAIVTRANPPLEKSVPPGNKPSIKQKEKEYAQELGEAVITAARFKPKAITLVSYQLDRLKKGRSELVIKMEYSGAVTSRPYLAEIVVLLDTSSEWEVLNIRYSDNSKSPLAPNERKIQALIRGFKK